MPAEEWVVAVENYQGAKKLAEELSAEFPYKSAAEWFSILTMIIYTKERKIDEK